jgi:hypothetical protein
MAVKRWSSTAATRTPDSRFIAFPTQGKLKKIESVGGPPVTLCDSPTVLGGAWTRDDKIVFGSPAGLMQVSASGGSPSPITTDGTSGAPSLLPDGHHFVYIAELLGHDLKKNRMTRLYAHSNLDQLRADVETLVPKPVVTNTDSDTGTLVAFRRKEAV